MYWGTNHSQGRCKKCNIGWIWSRKHAKGVVHHMSCGLCNTPLTRTNYQAKVKEWRLIGKDKNGTWTMVPLYNHPAYLALSADSPLKEDKDPWGKIADNLLNGKKSVDTEDVRL